MPIIKTKEIEEQESPSFFKNSKIGERNKASVSKAPIHMDPIIASEF